MVEGKVAAGSAPVLGRRIVIWGPPGSGKSTLARHLADRWHLTRIELDAIRHARGWDSVPNDEMVRTLQARLDAAPDGWVVDGNYSCVHSVLLPWADTLIVLHLSLILTFPRVVRRSVLRALSRKSLYVPGGPRERLWTQLFDPKESLWWYVLYSHSTKTARRRRLAAEMKKRAHVYVLTTPREVERLMHHGTMELSYNSAGAEVDRFRDP